MAMPVILKGDTSARISFVLTDNFSYEGYSLRVDFHHVSYVIYDLKAGSTVSVQYTAEDTSRFPLGTGLMTLTLENEDGVKRTLPVERVKVTDAPAEVYDGAIIIDPGVAKVEELPERFTDNDVRSKINQILSFFRRCAAFCLLGIMSYGFVAASVLTAPKGEIYNDSPVVTNVNLEGLAVKSEIPQVVTNVVRDVSDTLFNNYISATNDNFVAAVNASQVSVDDSVVAEIAEYAGVDVPTAGAASIGTLFIVILGGLAALKFKKQDALSQEQVVAVNSGITADKVSKLEGIEAGAQKNPDLSGYATKSEIPYSLIEVPLADRINLTDRAVNKVTADGSLNYIQFVFPEKKEGKSRDFFLRLVITGEIVPTLSFNEPNGDSVSFDVDDDSWADIEQGVNILMFTDTEE